MRSKKLDEVDMDVVPPDIAGRLRQAMKHRGFDNTRLAKETGMRRNSIGDILGGGAPGADSIIRICLALRTHSDYVLMGIGPRWFEDSAVDLQPVSPKPALVMGVDQWLASEKAALSNEERAYMQNRTWPEPTKMQPASVYLSALAQYRKQRAAAPAPDGQVNHPADDSRN